MLRKIIAKRDRFDRGVRKIVRLGIEEGLFRRGDPKLLTFAILGAVNWIPRWFYPAGAARSKEIGEAFADFLLAGLVRSGRRSRQYASIPRVNSDSPTTLLARAR
jgi:hypothetical protein